MLLAVISLSGSDNLLPGPMGLGPPLVGGAECGRSLGDAVLHKDHNKYPERTRGSTPGFAPVTVAGRRGRRGGTVTCRLRNRHAPSGATHVQSLKDRRLGCAAGLGGAALRPECLAPELRAPGNTSPGICPGAVS